MKAIYEKHGRSNTSLHQLWLNIKDRCGNSKNPYFHNYGGRGITICDEWGSSFSAFSVAVGERPSPRHTIDRIDNDLGYVPGNIRWATRKEQAQNMRKNNFLEHNGRTQTIAAWAEEIGVVPSTLWYRIFIKGLPVSAALTMSRYAR